MQFRTLLVITVRLRLERERGSVVIFLGIISGWKAELRYRERFCERFAGFLRDEIDTPFSGRNYRFIEDHGTGIIGEREGERERETVDSACCPEYTRRPRHSFALRTTQARPDVTAQGFTKVSCYGPRHREVAVSKATTDPEEFLSVFLNSCA